MDSELGPRFAGEIIRAARRLGATRTRVATLRADLEPLWRGEGVRRRTLYEAFERLDAGPDLLSIFASSRDTLTDREVVEMLEDWNDGLPQFATARRRGAAAERGPSAAR